MEPASKSNTGDEDLCSQERRRFRAGPDESSASPPFLLQREAAGHLESVDVRSMRSSGDVGDVGDVGKGTNPIFVPSRAATRVG
jgi:hypothetical protein